MENVLQEKSLQLAIQLNLIFPGFGYFYIGKKVVGIIAALLVIGIFIAKGFPYLVQAYLVMNAVMAIDMLIWNSRTKKKIAAQQDSAATNRGVKGEEEGIGEGQKSS